MKTRLISIPQHRLDGIKVSKESLEFSCKHAERCNNYYQFEQLHYAFTHFDEIYEKQNRMRQEKQNRLTDGYNF
jgi:hypothetical protein